MNKNKSPFIYNNSSLKKHILNYIIALIPLIIYGFYKNGLFLYKKELISLTTMFKPLLLPFLGAGLFSIVNFVFSLIKKEKFVLLNNSNILCGLILGMIVQPNISIMLFILTILVSSIICKLLSFIKVLIINNISLSKIIFCFSFFLFSVSSYLNAYESSVILDLSIFDIFFGLSSGGISETNIFLCLVGYSYLCTTKLYKKEIPLYLIGIYSVLCLFYCIIINDYSLYINNILTNGFIFASIFVAPFLEYTPMSYKGRRLYSYLLIFAFIATSIFLNTEAIYIAIAITSLFTPLIDKKYSF